MELITNYKTQLKNSNENKDLICLHMRQYVAWIRTMIKCDMHEYTCNVHTESMDKRISLMELVDIHSLEWN
ncbi:hypothetical protein AB6A40_002943 [Gnathostoma spinigerum]|uniref:Uncharacterized protein n=1 Tax=Gnathostoma spinigerum TaxID=75299 RepID=A0ABD6EFW3_9BILA